MLLLKCIRMSRNAMFKRNIEWDWDEKSWNSTRGYLRYMRLPEYIRNEKEEQNCFAV